MPSFRGEYQEALAILERIPPEIVAAYKIGPSVERECPSWLMNGVGLQI